jgi:hypothetical protein
LTLGSPAPCLLPAKYRQFLPPKSLSLTCCNSYSSPQISIASKNWNPFVHLYKEMQWFSYVLQVNGHIIWHNLSDSLTTYLLTYVIYQYLQLVWPSFELFLSFWLVSVRPSAIISVHGRFSSWSSLQASTVA